MATKMTVDAHTHDYDDKSEQDIAGKINGAMTKTKATIMLT